MIVVGFGLGKRAGCVALKLLKRPACSDGGLVAKRGMRPDIVAIVTPEGQFLAGIREAVEYLLIQALVSQTAVEAFDQAILLRFSWIDVVPGHAGIAFPFEDRVRGELDPIACRE